LAHDFDEEIKELLKIYAQFYLENRKGRKNLRDPDAD
jgi:hypothetical protein